MAASADPAKQLPIAGVEISVAGGLADASAVSGPSGFFTIPLSWRVRVGERVVLEFRHPDYQPLDLPYNGGNDLYLARMVPLGATSGGPEVPISNVIARYSVRTTTAVNIGSAVKTFQVVNTGNQLCKGRKPCSPDGRWKAAFGAVTMDAGPGNEFHNARASCIAGPCPFTRIEENGDAAHPTRTLRVSALNWSDTATFVVEAEVYRPLADNAFRQSYPIIFDRALTFTLPPSADEISIEAEVNGASIVFPLGPKLLLTWANCQLLVSPDQSKVCRCELKAGYRFGAPAVSAGRSADE